MQDENGLPIREHSYRKWFRQIARPAGIPDEVGSMDGRAGGTGESDEAVATIEEMRDGLTYTETQTTVRYIHRRGAKVAALAKKRSAKRAAESNDGTAQEPRVRIASESKRRNNDESTA